MKKYIVFAALALCLGALSAASTHAQTNKNIIYACYHKDHGQLRKVGGPGECKKDEKLLSWNIAGVPGPPGPKGDKGDPASTDPRVVQLRVNGSCSPAQFIFAIGEDGSVTCGASPAFGGVVQLNAVSNPGSQHTILDLGVLNLKVGCLQDGLNKSARFTITPIGGAYNVVFDRGDPVPTSFSAVSEMNSVILSGDGARKFFVQMTQQDGSPTVTVHGSVVNYTNGNSVCFFQWSGITQ
jgi:hypothetical protein